MKQCPFCYRENNDRALFCKCGEPLQCPDLFGELRPIDEWLRNVEKIAQNDLPKLNNGDNLEDNDRNTV